ncbi:MAG: prolipoprotein diacylglyceryl transferase [Candidatus Limnocylindria bacterium]
MIDPVALEIGPLQLHWYGIIIAAAVLVSAMLGARVARHLGENPEDGWSMLLWVVVLAVLGARIYHVVHEWERVYANDPLLVLQVWRGGLGMPGVIAGGALAVFLYTRTHGLSPARWMDIMAPAVLLGQAIGRLGNFVNQELYGPPTTLPWGVPIDAAHRIGPWMDLNAYPVETTRFHPLFAYEGLLNLVGMLVLLLIIRRFAPRLFAGDIILMYLIWYGAVRTVLEPLRVENWTILGIPTAMWLGVLAVVLAAAWLVIRHRRGWGSPLLKPGTDADAALPDAAAAPSAEASPG